MCLTLHMTTATLPSVGLYTTDWTTGVARYFRSVLIKPVRWAPFLGSCSLFSPASSLLQMQLIFDSSVALWLSVLQIIRLFLRWFFPSSHDALFWCLPFSLIFTYTEVAVLIPIWWYYDLFCAVWHTLSQIIVHTTIIKGSLVSLSQILEFMGF